MAFHAPHNIFQLVFMASNNHVHMAWHDRPSVNLEPFVLLAVLPAFDQGLFIFFSYKNVDPINCCKAYKIQLVAIAKFVFAAHACNLQNVFAFCLDGQWLVRKIIAACFTSAYMQPKIISGSLPLRHKRTLAPALRAIRSLRYLRDAPAIQMETPAHTETGSYGSSLDAKAFRAMEEKLINQGKFDEVWKAVETDYRDALNKTGYKPDESAIKASREYYYKYIVPALKENLKAKTK